MGRQQYYTLISSLPKLHRFDLADRLPINQVRLEERMRMLGTAHFELVEGISAFLKWQRQPVKRTDLEVFAGFKKITEAMGPYPVLMEEIGFIMLARTFLAALRRRRRGQTTPPTGEPWGVGPWVRHIERNWDDPLFKLQGVFPWMSQVRDHLEGEEPLLLERLLMTLAWKRMDRLADQNPFGLEEVVAYLFKWDMLQRWLSYDHEAAKNRFEELFQEVIVDQEQHF